ncbi:amidohydrolase family protein [Frankia sp. CNm7]|uniref:Amidohydrolase family protein n=1 Tax=Frankia nepalensis TaxID=1836974 RepID=A0A937RFM7_9ACTN|nr:amidohydrolase family protein [Frankia nepalensis]MBL7501099.1 amidohydrolase family protein [Frankia nepalensis]MBL7512964.1 amidohydrolase family protein [Frankia nepalensis]MBL7519469.1 amidohydrolase family protein [Frankia nepalensis]MBL7631293.1 amidohydrolase family protein [Frankia nepalensis]
MGSVRQDEWIFDFDNHYYEAPDAFTRHQDRSLGSRGIRWADIDGRRRLVVGGKINNYIANPTFDPVARPGCLYSWYRGNPDRQGIREAFGRLEPLSEHPEYQDREARLRVLDEQRVAATLLFPTLGVGVEDALKDDPDAAAKVFHGFNRWLEEDWGYRYEDRLYAVPYVPLLDPAAAVAELRDVLGRGAVAVNVRNAPVPVPGGYRSPFDPAYDGFWGLAEESGIVVATHAGVDGYDTLVQMWEPGREEQSVLRSPLRGVLTKGRAVADFYGAALCHLIFERFPRLRMASVENGAGWIPDLLHRLDDVANRNPGFFKEHPRDVFGEHVWVTPFWEDQIDERLLADVRVDRLLLGSDWPHAEGVVAPVDFVTESLGHLPAEDLQKVARDNALDVLALAKA